MYMAPGAAVRVFLKCIRPVIVVEVAHIKGKYKDIMLVMVSIDANKQIYSFAFRLGKRENDDLWIWFMRRLQASVGVINGLVFSDDCSF